MATIKTTITTIRNAAHALSLDDINAKLRAAGETPITRHSLAHARDLGFIQESTRTPGKWFTVKAKRAEIDGWSRPAAAPAPAPVAVAVRPVVVPDTAPARREVRPIAVSSNPRDFSAVQIGVLMTLRGAAHGVKGEDLSLPAVGRLSEMGIVRVDKRDRNINANQARWFVRKGARAGVDAMLRNAMVTLR